MTILKTGPTAIAQWHDIVLEAQSKTGVYLDENVENYVVLTLFGYTQKTKLSSMVFALAFLENIGSHSIHHLQKLREVGDHCLILSGLFPHFIKRKNVSSDYLIRIGREAYHQVSVNPFQWQFDAKLFDGLCDHFLDLTQLLKTMRIKDPIK